MKKKKVKVQHKRIYAPLTSYKPVPSEIHTDDNLVRRNEYLLAICEISGSMEGNELESLRNAAEENMGTYAYEENFDKYYDFDIDEI